MTRARTWIMRIQTHAPSTRILSTYITWIGNCLHGKRRKKSEENKGHYKNAQLKARKYRMRNAFGEKWNENLSGQYIWKAKQRQARCLNEIKTKTETAESRPISRKRGRAMQTKRSTAAHDDAKSVGKQKRNTKHTKYIGSLLSWVSCPSISLRRKKKSSSILVWNQLLQLVGFLCQRARQLLLFESITHRQRIRAVKNNCKWCKWNNSIDSLIKCAYQMSKNVKS